MKKKLCLLLACVTALGILFSSCGNKEYRGGRDVGLYDHRPGREYRG